MHRPSRCSWGDRGDRRCDSRSRPRASAADYASTPRSRVRSAAAGMGRRRARYARTPCSRCGRAPERTAPPNTLRTRAPKEHYAYIFLRPRRGRKNRLKRMEAAKYIPEPDRWERFTQRIVIRPLQRLPAGGGAAWSWKPQVLATLRFPDSRLCPGWSRPTLFNSGQSPCSGWGSDVMLCARPSLLTKRTRVPVLTVSVTGLAPADVIVIVVASDPPDGALGVPPPHDAAGTTQARTTSRFTRLIIAPASIAVQTRADARYCTVMVPRRLPLPLSR